MTAPVRPAGPLTAGDPELVALRRFTDARIALGRAGVALPTGAQLRFAADHARARDAVWSPLEADTVAAGLAALGLAVVPVASSAADRVTYLRRPDLGRHLAPESKVRLGALPRHDPVALVVADGLSAAAVAANAVPTVAALLPRLRAAGLACGTVVLATQARVALGDDIGATMAARLAIVLIGERPGLSAADSLGCYLTHAPRPGTPDSARNCFSNIRMGGLAPDAAAARIAWLAREAVARGLTGVALKDESGPAHAIPTAGSRDLL